MASVVPTLSASELDETVEDEELWYQKIWAGENMQPEELARLHQNTKNLVEHVRFVEQNRPGAVPETVITRAQMEELGGSVCLSDARPSPAFLDYTGRLRKHIDDLEERLCPLLLRPPLSRRGVQIAQDDLGKCWGAGPPPLTEREQRLYMHNLFTPGGRADWATNAGLTLHCLCYIAASLGPVSSLTRVFMQLVVQVKALLDIQVAYSPSNYRVSSGARGSVLLVADWGRVGFSKKVAQI